ncbi:hypothetical protein [Virgibacillus alimentarius]|uniref:hypothetical protein n=1 Tax=Virgibacillus alimentarius TaxID=698769 RepID=UPI000AA7BD0F|nr:hypothetical protein [Virgibacillus alimentarius]
MMETTQNEKSLRLQKMLQESLKPMMDRLEALEKEMESVRKGQQELKKMVEDSRENK